MSSNERRPRDRVNDARQHAARGEQARAENHEINRELNVALDENRDLTTAAAETASPARPTHVIDLSGMEAPDLGAHLRATSDGLILASEELIAIETQKRHLAPADPRFRRYAREVRQSAAEVLGLAEQEEQLAEALENDVRSAELQAIEQTQPRSALASILDEWRTVDRALEATVPGSEEAAALIVRFNRLRAEYGQGMTLQLRGGTGSDASTAP
jgi:hypothetical protein